MAMNDSDKTRVSADYRKKTPTINDYLAELGSTATEFVDEGLLRHYNEGETGPERILGLTRDLVPMADMVYRGETGGEPEVTDVLNFTPGLAFMPLVLKKTLRNAKEKVARGIPLTDAEKREMARLEEIEMHKDAALKQPSMTRRFLENIQDEDLVVDQVMRSMRLAPNDRVFNRNDLNSWREYIEMSGGDPSEVLNKVYDKLYTMEHDADFDRMRKAYLERRKSRERAAHLLRANRGDQLNIYDYFKSIDYLDPDDVMPLQRAMDNIKATGDRQLYEDFKPTYDRLMKMRVKQPR